MFKLCVPGLTLPINTLATQYMCSVCYNNIFRISLLSSSNMEKSKSSSASKRKKFYTKGEVIELLKQKNHKIMDVSREITEALCPFDLTETEDDDISEKLQKL